MVRKDDYCRSQLVGLRANTDCRGCPNRCLIRMSNQRRKIQWCVEMNIVAVNLAAHELSERFEWLQVPEPPINTLAENEEVRGVHHSRRPSEFS